MNVSMKIILVIITAFSMLIISFCEDEQSPAATPTPTIPPTLDCEDGQWQAGFECVSETLFRAPVSYDESLYYNIWHTDVYEGEQDPLCMSYNGSYFGECYAGHKGSDFMLTGDWSTMDQEIAYVLAAAPGEVVSVEDGNYDRCHGDIASGYISCDGNPIVGNHVKVRHQDGIETWYWHFKKDTILVSVGDWVECGEKLGLVGSSGVSFAPHLHFQVMLPTGEDDVLEYVDPFAGEYTQEHSYWVLQDGPYNPNHQEFPLDICQGYYFPDEE